MHLKIGAVTDSILTGLSAKIRRGARDGRLTTRFIDTSAGRIRKKAAQRWYRTALPRRTAPEPFQKKALDALSGGACFCLAGVVQGLAREEKTSLRGVSVPCTMIWGAKDLSHKFTDPNSLQEIVPEAEVVHFDECGHFPDLEQPDRFAALLLDKVILYS
jgi:pimeloyl-ACP methyl ester carboxylesterase